MAPRVGFEPHQGPSTDSTKNTQNRAKSLQKQVLTATDQSSSLQSRAQAIHNSNTSQQPICVPGVYDADLVKVIDAWEQLPPSTRSEIMSLLDSKE